MKTLSLIIESVLILKNLRFEDLNRDEDQALLFFVLTTTNNKREKGTNENDVILFIFGFLEIFHHTTKKLRRKRERDDDGKFKNERNSDKIEQRKVHHYNLARTFDSHE